MATHQAAAFFSALKLTSPKRSLLMLVVTWTLNLLWLGINYFWRFASKEVLVAVPLLLLLYAVVALVAYIYWGLRQVKEEDLPYANVMVGAIVAFTLLYLNLNFLQFLF